MHTFYSQTCIRGYIIMWQQWLKPNSNTDPAIVFTLLTNSLIQPSRRPTPSSTRPSSSPRLRWRATSSCSTATTPGSTSTSGGGTTSTGHSSTTRWALQLMSFTPSSSRYCHGRRAECNWSQNLLDYVGNFLFRITDTDKKLWDRIMPKY